MKKVIMASSNVASNIGNDFFYRGIHYAISKVKPDLAVIDSYFSPYNAYGLSKKMVSNNFDYFSSVSGVDAILIAGPVLDVDFEKHFSRTLRNAKESGKKILLLSVGGRSYDDAEIEHCRRVLSEYKPDVFVSRDLDTFEAYSDLALHSFNGVCFATFAPEYWSGYETSDLGSYIASCFDFAAEPDLQSLLYAYENSLDVPLNSYTTKSRIDKFKHVLQRNLPGKLGSNLIIRTCHRPMRTPNIIFNRSNVISSFISAPYLNIYKNCKFTVTDRLHAAVVTMAFGNPAYLALKSNRTRLLDRAGMAGCKSSFYIPDLEYLASEKNRQLDFLKTTFDELFK